ncbi:MAG: hypothetical protein NC132_06565 [Corallococcus sp.]|nr:hypothetical protein [Corallococcus sp.]
MSVLNFTWRGMGTAPIRRSVKPHYGFQNYFGCNLQGSKQTKTSVSNGVAKPSKQQINSALMRGNTEV